MRKKIALILLVLADVMAGTAFAEDGPWSAGRIFDLGAGGRAIGMGSAYTAMSGDVNSVYYNPSGLGLLDGRQVQMMHAQLFGGAAYDYLGYAQNLKRKPGGWGVQLLRMGVSGGEGRDEVNKSVSAFSYTETGIGFGLGMRGVLLPNLSLGTGAKILTRTLGNSSDRLLGLDLGSQYGPLWDGRLNLGLAVHNVVSQSQGDTSDNLPMSIRLAAAWKLIGPLTLAMDVSDSRELRVGTEYSFGFMAMRAGYAPDGMSFGGGMLIKKSLSLDMAVVSNSALGMSQRLSMGWRFGAKKPKKLTGIAESYFSKGTTALAQRNYLQALRSIEAAYGIDPNIGGPRWKKKVMRLKALLGGMEIREDSDIEEFSSGSKAALLVQQSIEKYMEGDDVEAMLLAHVAAGTADRHPLYMNLLTCMATQTRQQVRRDDIVAADTFVATRLDKTLEAFHSQRYDLAVSSVREALMIQPQNATAWMRMGSAYFALGDRAKSLQAYRKALQLEPGNLKLMEFVKENFKE